ncbi:MAG: GAF domain-containing protein [Bacteroidetes bacterium]|jgi:L-methionine (R)-S-oxide reductase|nr:GAF domain-containing protein [Bacteroidota bacterium]
MPETGSSFSLGDRYQPVMARIQALLSEPCDWTAAMATVACELHHAFDHFHWTGFYRTVRPGHLQIGPYQGTHGCLDIPFERGVCGAAARSKQTQLVPDVNRFPGHIACSSTTRSEIVVPVLNSDGHVIAVLDVDSNDVDAFDEEDRISLEWLCDLLGTRWGSEAWDALST